MGNRIAILREGSEIAQLDTPEAILAHRPTNLSRASWVPGQILKGLTLKKVSDIELHQVPNSTSPVMRERGSKRLSRIRLIR